MGAAVTQGWEIKKAGRDSLILQRDLDDVAAQNLAPGASRGPLPPVVEVRTDFFDRSGGVNVQLAAEVVTGRGTNKEVRQDYTETYRNELMHSLSILQTDWHEAGPKIANALPPIGGMRDNAPADYSASPSGTNPPPETLSSNPLGDITEGLEEDQPSSASNWSLPPPAAATATAAAVARANAIPNKVAPVTPLPKAPQVPKGPPPTATVTKMAAAPAPSLFTSAPRTSTVPSPKGAPVSTIQVRPPVSGGKLTPSTVTKPASVAAGSAKSNAATANTKSTPAVTATSNNSKTSTATTKSATVAATKTPAKVTPSSSSPPVTKAKAVPSVTKSSVAPAANSKTTGTTASKAASAPAKTASAAKPNTSKAKEK